MMRVSRATFATGLVLALVLVACGSDGEPTDNTGATGSTGSTGTTGPLEGPLVIGSWGGELDEANLRFLAVPFAAETGVETQYVPAPGQHVALITAQQEAGDVQWDMVDGFSGYDFLTLADAGLLEPLPDDLRATLESILPEGTVLDFGVRHLSTASVITCQTEVAAKCPTTAAEFFDVENFPGSRMMYAYEPITGLILAAEALREEAGEDPRATPLFPIDLDAAFAKLEELKPSIEVWYQGGGQAQGLFASGDIAMGPIFQSRVWFLRQAEVPIQASFVDASYIPAYFGVVKDAPHKEAAFAYLEWFYTHPEEVATWGEAVGYMEDDPELLNIIDPELAAAMPNHPDNIGQVALEDFDFLQWEYENADEINTRWQELIAG